MLGCLQIYPLFSGHTCAACVCGTNFAHCSLFAFVLGQAYIIFSMLPQASGIEATDLDGGGFSSDDGASAANDQDGGGFSSNGEGRWRPLRVYMNATKRQNLLDKI